MPTPTQIISLPAAIAIGIGGMIGAGIFSILGVVAETAGAAMWISFLIGGIVALFSTYSYAKLGATFPSAGGPVEFLVQGWGKGTLSGGINLFMWIGYIISIALYAQGFSAYCLTFFTTAPAPFYSKLIAAAIVILFAGINFLGARSVGNTELLIVIIKVSILILFASCGLFYIHPQYLSLAHEHINPILFGAGILFIGYEGFGLVTNAAANMVDPKKTLPQALYLSVIIVMIIYLAVAVTVTGNLTADEIAKASDFALAQAAQPFFGEVGFKLIAIAALFSTASAINATLFGSANVCYMIARDGELPENFERTEWKNASEGLIITALLVICFILFFDLASIAMMGSGAFLLIYAAVNAGHLRIIQQTGAKKSIVWLSLILCLAMFGVLEVYTFKQAPVAVYTMVGILAASLVGEKIYGRLR